MGTQMSAIYFIGGTVVACGLILMGWSGEGYLHKASLILGGLYFGHLITDALIGRTE